jgi:hypothetical protein
VSGRCPEDLEPCGTAAAYRRHLRKGEDVRRCRPCQQAEARRKEDYQASLTGQQARERRRLRRQVKYWEARKAGLSSVESTRFSRTGVNMTIDQWINGGMRRAA